MISSRFLTIRRVLERGGFREGEHYRVLDNKRHFGSTLELSGWKAYYDAIVSLAAGITSGGGAFLANLHAELHVFRDNFGVKVIEPHRIRSWP